MSRNIKIKKGVDIKLKGTARRVVAGKISSNTYAIKPTDFHGLTPKLAIKQGDEVKAGSTLFYDKYNEAIKFASPVSGEVVEIVRGDRRKVLEIKILADSEMKYEDFGAAEPTSLSADEVKSKMLAGGVWPLVKQRPYDVVADPNQQPKAIHITAFNSAPLEPDFDFILAGEEEAFQAGLNALNQLAEGKVFLNIPYKKNVHFDADEEIQFVDKTGETKSVTYNVAEKQPDWQPARKVLEQEIAKREKPSAMFTEAKNVKINAFDGPHPAGNVGIQIHHISPINKGEKYWTLNAQGVVLIGRLFLTGKFDARKIVALAGPKVKSPQHYEVIVGASIESLSSNVDDSAPVRYISGNVLTGTQIDKAGYLGFYDNLVTVLEEGYAPDLFGWAVPFQPEKFSISRTLFSWLNPDKEYSLNTNMNGEPRAFVVTGEYEKVFPMNIYPVQLAKACITQDIEMLESLGIYEVAPEDFALCEFACTSKTPVQSIIREGLDLVKKECE